MHMADALISPAVGGTMWAASASAIGWSCKKVRAELSDFRVPLMGVMAAFTFAAQMINFSIPGTGSSGHLGGGVLLAALLGPHAALLTIVSVLAVQAVFFADGGLLALGCNIFNLGFIPCLVAYPLVFRRISVRKNSPRFTAAASFAAAIVALQLGAFSVVLQTVASGITELPFQTFALLMQPIHLAVGLVEGAATSAVLSFLSRSRPDLLETAACSPVSDLRKGRAVRTLAVLALLIGGVVSWFAATEPDGLEWAVSCASGENDVARYTDASPHRAAAALQAETALLPDYDFKPSESEAAALLAEPSDAWPSPSTGTSIAGIVGGIISLVIAAFVAWLLGRRKTLGTS